MNRFQKDVLDNYDATLGLKPEVESLKKQKTNLHTEISTARAEQKKDREQHLKSITRLENSYSKLKEDIGAYTELRQLGIDGKTIRMWRYVMAEARLNPADVEAELKEIRGLAKSKDKLQFEIDKLKVRSGSLQTAVSDLESKKAGLVAAIKVVTDGGIEQIRSISSEAKKNIYGTSSKTRVLLDELSLQAKSVSESTAKEIKEYSAQARDSVKRNISDSAAETTKSADQLLSDLRELLEKARPEIATVTRTLELGEKLGRYESILPILELYQSGEGPEEDVLPVMLKIFTNFQSWSSNKPWYEGLSNQLSTVVNKVKEVLLGV